MSVWFQWEICFISRETIFPGVTLNDNDNHPMLNISINVINILVGLILIDHKEAMNSKKWMFYTHPQLHRSIKSPQFQVGQPKLVSQIQYQTEYGHKLPFCSSVMVILTAYMLEFFWNDTLFYTEWVWRINLVSLVVESYPGDSGVARTSEADDLLWMTPLEHPHASILSSRQVWRKSHTRTMFGTHSNAS